jgi:ribosomal protein S18 acetylase RimI-like enzyme
VSPLDIRLLEQANADRLIEFFDRIPPGDMTFFKEPVTGTATVDGWLADEQGTRLLAVEGDHVVGYAAIIRGVGWSSHVGELRLVVDPLQRRRQVGQRLATAALEIAVQQGLSKVVVEAIATQQATIGLFTKLGFVPEALLEDHVRRADGELEDLIVMAHHTARTWSALATVGLDAPLD